YHKLLPKIKCPKNVDTQERSSSGLIFYWGIKGSFPSLHLHNIFFSKNYEKEFQHIFEDKTVYGDPTVYVNITSKLNPGDAPEGHENWFVMVNTPCNEGQNWQKLTEEVRKNVLDKLSGLLKTDIEESIVSEKTLDPINIESKTSSFKGSLYGTSSNSKFAAFLRHPNFTSKLDNLYFCGGSVHPGGGIPLCLLSAKIVVESVREHMEKKDVIEVTA
ncbi:MAG: phytoene desaturase, partial [Bacteroidota bacterium]